MQKLIFLFSCALSVAGCEFSPLEVSATESNRELAFPLVDSRVTLPELTGTLDEEVTLTVDPDGLLRFNYTDTVPAVTSEEVFDQLRDFARGVPLVITERREALSFPFPEGVRLRELRIRSGTLTYSLPNTYNRPVRITLEIPNIRRDGQSFRIEGELPAYSGSGAVPTLTNVQVPLDLLDYTLDFSSDSLILEYAIDALDGQALQPAAGTLVALANVDFSYAEGFFRRTPFPGVSDRLAIDFFERYRGGDISFVDPSIRVTVRNGFGLPARAVIDELTVTTLDGRELPVTGEVVDSGFDFNYPTVPGAVSTTVYVADKSNSNVLELLSAKPVALNYRISALINPQDDATIKGFLFDTSTYAATVNVELPLYGQATDFVVNDTFPLRLGEDYPDLATATFRITTDNALPFDLTLAGTFVDAQGRPLADLTDGELLVIRASPVDAAGNTTEVIQTTTDVPFPADRVANIRRADRLLLRTTFATTNRGTTPVRVSDRQDLRVRIGVRITTNPQ